MLYSINNGVMFSWEAVYPLFAYTSVELGGLGLGISMIGTILALSAMLSIAMTAFVFPIMHRSISEKHLLTLCLAAYPVRVLFFPFVWALSRNGLGISACAVMTCQMVIRRVGDFAS